MISASIDGLDVTLKAAFDNLPKAATKAMGAATTVLKQTLREQVERAGLGRRLAATWQGRVYPEADTSLEPTGFVFSKAPNIISAYAKGATIVPVRGHRFLAIPSANVPFERGRGRGNKRRMNPFEVEIEFNQDIILRRGRRGTILGFVNVLAARSRRRGGFRRATAGRLAQGRQVKLVLMFTFVPSVKVAKVLDLDGAAARAARVFVSEMEREA